MKKLLLLLIIPLFFSCNKQKKIINHSEEKIEDLKQQADEDYILSIQEKRLSTEVLSVNGFPIKVKISYTYKPIENKVEYLEKEIGPDYHDKVIAPEIKSVTREVIGTYFPEELYSTARDAIEGQILDMLKTNLEKRHINLNSVLIIDLTLPEKLQSEIENKLKQEQEELEYDFKIEKAEKEAQRLEIDANGKSTENDILNSSLGENILIDKGIESTLNLSESNNSKVVIVGSEEDGLPLILNPE